MVRTKQIGIVGFILEWFCLILPGWAGDSPKVHAKVMFATGTVQVIRSGEEKSLPLARGDSIAVGDRIIVGANAKAVLVTSERKIINLAANSDLKIGDASGHLIEGLGLGMFAGGKGRSDSGAQATTRNLNSSPLLVSPRNSVIRAQELSLEFAPLQTDQRYEIEVVGINPKFVYKTKIAYPEHTLTQKQLRQELKTGEAYYVYVRKLDANGVELEREQDLRVGLLDTQSQARVSQVEKELTQFMNEDRNNPAYPTLLAETYEANFLNQDAVQWYEKIYREIAPGDAYSLERLKHLYSITRNSPALKALETSR